MIGQENPSQLLPALLTNAAKEDEATLILNTAVLLKDFAGYEILIDDEMIPASFGSEQRLNIDRRLNYLLSN